MYNVAFGERTTLNELFTLISERVVLFDKTAIEIKARYRDFRAGDVHHSLADISKAEELIYYRPLFSVETGLDKATTWYLNNRQ